MLFLFVLVCVYSGFGWLFSRVGYNRAFPLIGGNQESGMVRGRPRSGSGLTGIWAIGYARTCPEWVVGENSGCGIRDNEFAWWFCWGMPTVSEFMPRPATPQNTTHVSVGGRSCRGGDLSGLPGMCLPRHRKQRPHGFANSGWCRAHTRYLTAQGPGVRIHCASRHTLGAPALKYKPDGTPVSEYLAVGFTAG